MPSPTLSGALLVGLVLATSLSAAEDPFAAGPDVIKSFDIYFEGHYDGISGTYDTSTGMVIGSWTCSCCICPYPDAFGGTLGSVAGQGSSLILASETNYEGPPYFYTVINGVGKVVTLYYFDGTVLASANWRPCPPVGVEGGGDTPLGAR